MISRERWGSDARRSGINLLFEVIDTGSIVFGSEMIGAVRGIDPQTRYHFDETRRYVDALHLPSDVQAQIYELNARRIYPRLNAPGRIEID
jgi:4-oxalmesaconate hydratase